MKKIITFLYLLILAYACYDDKGNYDYREINQISIQNIDSLVLCDQMDLLSIPVTLEGTQYSENAFFNAGTIEDVKKKAEQMEQNA